jgi:hypothetical protein
VIAQFAPMNYGLNFKIVVCASDKHGWNFWCIDDGIRE